MNWWLVAGLLIAAYAVVALVVYTRKLFPDNIMFYGPIMAIKSPKTTFPEGRLTTRNYSDCKGHFWRLHLLCRLSNLNR